MRTYAAADGDLHGTKGKGAIDADALGGDFDLVIVVVHGIVGSCSCSSGPGGILSKWVAVGVWSIVFIVVVVGGGGGGWMRAGRVGVVGKPGGWVGDGWGVVLGVAGVVDDFFEPDVVVVGGVSVQIR